MTFNRPDLDVTLVKIIVYIHNGERPTIQGLLMGLLISGTEVDAASALITALHKFLECQPSTGRIRFQQMYKDMPTDALRASILRHLLCVVTKMEDLPPHG